MKVIQKEELKPGDIILVYAPKDELSNALTSCEYLFKGYNVRILGVPNYMDIRVIDGQESKK